MAQLLVKRGTAELGSHLTLMQVVQNPPLFFRFVLAMLANVHLFAGYALSGITVVLLTLALRGSELSRIYPVIVLTYVWVTALAVFMLPSKHLNLFRTTGIPSIVPGVSALGLKK